MSAEPTRRPFTPTLLFYGLSAIVFAAASVPMALGMSGFARGVVLALGALLLMIGVLTLLRHPLAPLSFLSFAGAILVLGIISIATRGPTRSGIMLLVSAAITAPGYLVLRSELDAVRRPNGDSRERPRTMGATVAGASAGATAGPGPGPGIVMLERDFVEDCRPLAHFYPGESQRAELHYIFAHQFFRTYFFLNPRGVVRQVEDSDEDSTRYIQARWQMMEQRLKLVDRPELVPRRVTFRRVTDLSAWKQLVAGRATLCVEMPIPEQPPHAYFLALVLPEPPASLDDRTRTADVARYFALERTVQSGVPVPVGSPAVLCEWTPDGVHNNLATMVAPTRSAFVEAVTDALDVPRRPAHGS